MKTMKLMGLSLVAAAAMLIAGCSKGEKTMAGAGLGGATGAVIGGVASKSAAGAVVGGLIGAVAGGAIGNSMGDDAQ